MSLSLSLQTWSWILTLGGAATAWMAGTGGRRAWLTGLGCQSLWLLYAVSTGQQGFLGSVAIFGAIYVRNLVKGRPSTPAGCCCDSSHCRSRARLLMAASAAGAAAAPTVTAVVLVEDSSRLALPMPAYLAPAPVSPPSARLPWGKAAGAPIVVRVPVAATGTRGVRDVKRGGPAGWISPPDHPDGPVVRLTLGAAPPAQPGSSVTGVTDVVGSSHLTSTP